MAKNKGFSLKKNKKRRALIWVATIVGAVVFITAAYLTFGQSLFRQEIAGPTTDPTIAFTPATEDEKQQADQNKERLAETKQESEATIPSDGQTPSSNKKSVKPTVTEASRSSVKGYITGIFEEGGVCTATFTKDGSTLTKTSDGFQNASYTQCSPIDLPSDFLAPGKWAVTLSYSSTQSAGESDIQYIE